MGRIFRTYQFSIYITIIQLFAISLSFACTNLLITPGASKDGSAIISYLADSHSLYGELYFKPNKDYPDGSLMDIYEWDTGKFLGKINQVKHTYKVIGNMNEHQLVIGETTFTGRTELQDTLGVLDYGNLMYIALQRAKTAREAILLISQLANEYGYYSTGESFSIADTKEVWIMELIGKGVGNKGIVWVARKVPDGYICAHANQSRIKQFPLNNFDECMFSPDVINFARSKGYYKGDDKNFSFADTYSPQNFETLRFCEARVYSLFHRSAPSLNLKTDYVKGINGAESYPLWIKPDKKLSVQDAILLMRDHFEGTEFDMTKDIGAGPFQCPYRWRPLTWQLDSIEYFNERAISTQQTGFSFISQSRSWLPNSIGGVLWFGVDDTYSTVYIPIYSGISEVPFNYAQGNGDLFNYSATSAFWAFNYVSNYSYLLYNDMIKDVQIVQAESENSFFELQPNVEKNALEKYNAGEMELLQIYLTEYSKKQGATTFDRWQKLGHELLVKFMDGNVKTKDKKVLHPRYPDWWYQTIIDATGEKFKVKEFK